MSEITNKIFFAPDNRNAPSQRLAWGLFWRLLTAQSGALLFAAAAICFFAYNWAEISAFAKFGLIVTLMAAFSAPALLRGFSSSSAHLCLLVCGILGGVLFAVFGQVYQTGADAWELFRAWAFLLIPLFLISRRSGLCFTLWLVATLWAGMYWREDLASVPMRLGFLCVETADLLVFETTARFCSGKTLPFLGARWIPRCFGFVLLGVLSLLLAQYIFDFGKHWSHSPDEAMRSGFILLYFFLMTAGGFWYLRKQRDLFMMASGLLSLIFLSMCLLVKSMEHSLSLFRSNGLLSWIFLFIALLALSAGAGKLLIHLHRQFQSAQESAETEAEKNAQALPPNALEAGPGLYSLPSLLSWQVMRFALRGVTGESLSSETKEASPWVARVLMGLCAWISVPLFLCFMAALIALMGSDPQSSAIAIASFLLLGGILLSQASGVFVRQAVLCTTLTAAITLSIFIPFTWWRDSLYFVPGILVFACSAPWVRNEAYRFIAVVTVVVLSFVQLDWHMGTLIRNTVMELPDLSLIRCLFAAVFSLTGAALAYLWESSREPLVKLRWLSRGGIIAFMILGLFPLFYSQILMMWRFHLSFGIVIVMVGVGASVGLFVFAWRLSIELSFSRLVRTAAFVLCLIVTLISCYWMPWFSVGIFALALARYAASLPFFGLSVAYLFFCVFMEYYNQLTTLLQKSQSLGIAALFLVLAAYLLHFLLSRALKNADLTIPEELADFCVAPRARDRHSREDSLLRAALSIFLVVFAALFINSVREKENLLENGTPVLLELAPRDPRSLMQGDYMALNFSLERDIASAQAEHSRAQSQDKGFALIEPDEKGVYRFVSLYDPALQLTGKQIKIVYRWKGRSPQISSGSFLFQEGHGEEYEAARYGELRVDADGNSLIVRLRNASLEAIEPVSGSGDR